MNNYLLTVQYHRNYEKYSNNINSNSYSYGNKGFRQSFHRNTNIIILILSNFKK